MENKMMRCPNDHGLMELKKLNKRTEFRGTNIQFQIECYVCPVCDIEIGTVDQASATQKAISDAYRREVGLLTSKEIRDARKRSKLSQAHLAQRMEVGIASIKRWESGLIQSKSMDQALRLALLGQRTGDAYTGNRTFSIPRVKLVLRECETVLRKSLLIKNDKLLYAAKYTWYADMVAYRELGKSMTGSTYACLTHGPQLNNYRDLVNEIMAAKKSEAEPLAAEEKRIINRVARAFPRKSMIYKTAHDEIIWQRRPIGAIIPYPDAKDLIAL